MEAFRVEHDLLGEIDVPKAALWGVHTARAVENFPITGVAIGHYRNLIKAMGLVKAAAAKAKDSGKPAVSASNRGPRPSAQSASERPARPAGSGNRNRQRTR
jgi:aspartate ammonia-lyase